MDEIRHIPESDLAEFVRIGSDAYPGMNLVTDEDRKKFTERLAERNKDPRVAMIGYYRDGRLIAGIRVFDYIMTVRGAQLLTGGGGFLTVDLPYKKEHIAKQIIDFYFAYYLRKKAAMAVLWPFRPDFYRKMGVGLGGKASTYRLRPGHLPKGPTKEHVTWLTESDLPEITACYNRYARQTNGMIEETPESLKVIYFGRPGRRLVGVRRNDKIEGFMYLAYEKAGARSFIDNNLVVIQFIFETREALSEMMTFLNSQDDQFHQVVLTTNDDYFHFLPLDPRNDSRNLVEPVYHETHLSSVGAMYRVLDTRQLFGLLAESDFNGATLTIQIDLRDTFLPTHAGSYVVVFKDGKPSIDDHAAPQVSIGLDVADFSSLIMGAVDFRSLYTYSLAEISTPALIAYVDRLFATDHRPVCTTPF